MVVVVERIKKERRRFRVFEMRDGNLLTSTVKAIASPITASY
jgi:hypothetical protein